MSFDSPSVNTPPINYTHTFRLLIWAQPQKKFAGRGLNLMKDMGRQSDNISASLWETAATLKKSRLLLVACLLGDGCRYRRKNTSCCCWVLRGRRPPTSLHNLRGASNLLGSCDNCHFVRLLNFYRRFSLLFLFFLEPYRALSEEMIRRKSLSCFTLIALKMQESK